MRLVERDQCISDLGELLRRAPEAFHAAMRRMRNASPEDLIDRTKTTGSNLTRDYAVAEFENLWHGNSEVRTYERGMLKLFMLKEQYLLRIKKLDYKSRSSNVRTGDDYRFRFQLPMVGIPRLPHLELGYVPNVLRTAVDDVRLVCLNGGGVYWSHSIMNPDSDENVYDLFMGKPGPNHPRPTPTPREDQESRETIKIKPKKR